MRNRTSRGKRVDSNEWVYGYYVKVKTLNKSEYEHFIIEEKADGNTYKILSETVGSYTGMNEFVVSDRTFNQPLYEKDIVEIWNYRSSCYSKSQYDGWIKVRGVICFREGKWDIDTNNEYNEKICKLKGHESYERDLKYTSPLFHFGYHGDDEEWHREHNHNYKYKDIIKIGNSSDTPELLIQ